MNTTAPSVTQEDVIRVLRRAPSECLPDILQFIEFVEYQAATEDEALWAAVEAERAYRQEHPGDIIVCDSVDELTAALESDE